MFAATASGIYNKVEDAMQAMGQGFDADYRPSEERAIVYAKRYEQYKRFGTFIEKETAQPAQENIKQTKGKTLETA